MNSPIVILKYQGKSTANEMYKLVLTSFQELTIATVSDWQQAKALCLELKECVAICENVISESKVTHG